jgi:hypothetical protein
MNGNGTSLSRDFLLLPPGQARVLAFVRAYYDVVGEPCSASLVARKLGRDVGTIRDHFAALHRKGWLRTRESPAWLKRERD